MVLGGLITSAHVDDAARKSAETCLMIANADARAGKKHASDEHPINLTAHHGSRATQHIATSPRQQGGASHGSTHRVVLQISALSLFGIN